MESSDQDPDPFTEEQILGDGMEIRSEVGSDEDNPEDRFGRPRVRVRHRQFLTQNPPDPDDDIANSPREPMKPFTQAEEVATIQISNLPVTTTKQDLINLYQQFGPIKFVRLRCMRDRQVFSRKQIQDDPFMTAYVCFSINRAQQATRKTNNTQFMGHVIRVTKPVHPIAEFKRSICVKDFPMPATKEDLVATFEQLGEIFSVKIKTTQLRERIGFVSFMDPKAIELAIKLNGSLSVKGRLVNVTRAREIYKTQKKEYRARKGIPEMKTVHEMRAGGLVKYRIPKNEEAKQLLRMQRAKAQQSKAVSGDGQNYQISSPGLDHRMVNDPNWQGPTVDAAPMTNPATPYHNNSYRPSAPPANHHGGQKRSNELNLYNQRQLLSVPIENGRVRARGKKKPVQEWKRENMVWRNPNI